MCYDHLKGLVSFGTAIDVGAHVGLWAYYMIKTFKRVVCFEPIFENRLCLELNCPKVEIMPYCLSSRRSIVKLNNPTTDNSGAWCVGNDGIDCKSFALDDFSFEDVDFVKIDVQGMEQEVINGSLLTFERYNPIVFIENVVNEIDFHGVGYKEVNRFNNDILYAIP